MSKPVLYGFPGSVWATVPQLAILESGYPTDHFEHKVLNLAEGENFAPSFLKVNPNGTLPTLEADGKAYTNTTDVTSYIVENAPGEFGKSSGTDLIQKLHEDRVDPNFASMAARNDEELKVKASGFSQVFLKNRQDVLSKHSSTPEGAEFQEFYDAKLTRNGGLHAVYTGAVPADGFFEKSNAHWDALRTFILNELPTYLPAPASPSGQFIGGVNPGEDDFHLAAWLARIVVAAGGKQGKDGVDALANELGESVPEKIRAYWVAWNDRASWKKLYGERLH